MNRSLAWGRLGYFASILALCQIKVYWVLRYIESTQQLRTCQNLCSDWYINYLPKKIKAVYLLFHNLNDKICPSLIKKAQRQKSWQKRTCLFRRAINFKLDSDWSLGTISCWKRYSYLWGNFRKSWRKLKRIIKSHRMLKK